MRRTIGLGQPSDRRAMSMLSGTFGRPCEHVEVRTHWVARVVVAVGVTTSATVAVDVPQMAAASADPCPDVEVVFARGTTESPGLGGFGTDFLTALRSKASGKSVTAYGVNYPASFDWNNSATTGAVDASSHVEKTVLTCPNTRIVLGGYSQGADVIALITAEGAQAWGTATPMPPVVAEHVAAVVVFGNPSGKVAGGPLTATSRLYGSKALDVCAGGDPVCSNGFNLVAHGSYETAGIIDQAATFAAQRL
jgi:cutinase